MTFDFTDGIKQAFSTTFSTTGFKLSLIAWALSLLWITAFFGLATDTAISSPMIGVLVAGAVLGAILTGVFWIGTTRSLYHENLRSYHFTDSILFALLNVILATIVTYIATGIGLLFLIIPGLIVYTGLYISTPLIVLEDKDVIDAITESWQRVQESILPVFGLIVAIWVITTVVMLPFQIISVVGQVIGSTTAQIIVAAITSYVGIWAQLLSTSAALAVYDQVSGEE